MGIHKHNGRHLLNRSLHTMSRKCLRLPLCGRYLLRLSCPHCRIVLFLLLLSRCLLFKASLQLLGERMSRDVQHGEYSRAAPVDLPPLRVSVAPQSRSVSLTKMLGASEPGQKQAGTALAPAKTPSNSLGCCHGRTGCRTVACHSTTDNSATAGCLTRALLDSCRCFGI